MTRQQTQNLIDTLISSTTMYEQSYPIIYNALMAQDCTTIETAVCRIQVSLYNQRLPWKNKLLGLRLLKDLITTASYSFFLIFEMLILPWLVETVKFRHELPIEQKCREVFLRNRTQNDSEIELIQTGKAIIKLSQEVIKAYAVWIPDTPYQLQSFPTLFQLQYQQLLQIGVRFPQNLQLFYIQNYNKKKTTQIPQNFCANIKNRLFELLGSITKSTKLILSPSQERCFIQGLIYTGDNHIINTVVDICRSFLKAQDSYRSEATGHIIDFINWMFALGDPQIFYQIRCKIVPIFTLFSFDDKNGYHDGIRNRSRQSLLRFSSLIKLVQPIGQYVTQYGVYDAILKYVPLEGVKSSCADLQQLLKLNLERRRKINLAKAAMWQGQSKEEKQLIDSLSKPNLLTFGALRGSFRETQNVRRSGAEQKTSKVSINFEDSIHNSIEGQASQLQLLSPEKQCCESNLQLHSSQKEKQLISRVSGKSRESRQHSINSSNQSKGSQHFSNQPSNISQKQDTPIHSFTSVQQSFADDDYAEYSSKNSQISRNSANSTSKMNETPPTKIEMTQRLPIQPIFSMQLSSTPQSAASTASPKNLTYALSPPADGYVCHPPSTKSKPSFAFNTTLSKPSQRSRSRQTKVQGLVEPKEALRIQEVYLYSNIKSFHH